MCNRKRRLAAALLALAVMLGCSPAALAVSDTATTMQMTKTEGTVSVSNSTGKNISVIKNMRLYNGYQLETEEESYAWVSLDSDKLVKLDAVSQAGIRKSGKKLEILLESGNLFLNVSQPLEDDESLNIRTSTIAVGIRGTSAIVEVRDKNTVQVTMLEGRAQLSVTDPVTGQVKTETVAGGESAACVVYPQDRTGDKCEIIRRKAEKDDVRGFVLEELARDPELAQAIFRESGLDLRDVTWEEARKRLEEDQESARRLLAEIEKAHSAQNAGVAASSLWTKPAVQPSGGNSGGSGGTVQPRPNSVTLAGGASAAEIAAALGDYDIVTVDGSCTLDADLRVPSGKTLNINGDLYVSGGISLTVDGTVNVAWTLDNEGTVIVNSANTLRTKYLLTKGQFTVTATGLVRSDVLVGDDIGTLTLTPGAQFYYGSYNGTAGTPVWPDGWAPVYDGAYYKLTQTATPDPDAGTFTVTFDPNGGSWETPSGTSTQPLVYTVAADTVLDFNASSVNYIGNKLGGTAKYEHSTGTGTGPLAWTLDGWADHAAAKSTVKSDTVTVSADMTFYAQWSWQNSTPPDNVQYYTGNHGDQLVVCGSGEIPGPGSSLLPWGNGWNPTTLKIEEGITRIGNSAFTYTALTSVTLPNSLKSIGQQAFEFSDLASITLPEGLTEIGGYAFEYCSSLTEVNFPSTLTEIGQNAFQGCTALTSINYSGTTDQWLALAANHIGTSAIAQGTEIKCSDGTLVANDNSGTSFTEKTTTP